MRRRGLNAAAEIAKRDRALEPISAIKPHCSALFCLKWGDLYGGAAGGTEKGGQRGDTAGLGHAQ